MFSTWKQEKTTASRVDEARALSDKLAEAKPHIVDRYAAAAQFWAASYLASGQNLHDLNIWPHRLLRALRLPRRQKSLLSARRESMTVATAL